MTGIRLLVGTRKGAFILTADGKRRRWNINGPLFGGWEIYHLKGAPGEPDRLYASQSSAWFGQLMQRSDDGGKTWDAVGNQFAYDGVPGTHQYYDGSSRPWEFKRVWHLEPSLTEPDTVYAGVEDAALFRSTDAGKSWQELAGLRGHGSGPELVARSGRPVPAYHSRAPGRQAAHVGRDLGGRRISHRRWRRHMAARQPRAALGADPRPDGRGRPLRAPHRAASNAAGYLVHAEALGRDA